MSSEAGDPSQLLLDFCSRHDNAVQWGYPDSDTQGLYSTGYSPSSDDLLDPAFCAYQQLVGPGDEIQELEASDYNTGSNFLLSNSQIQNFATDPFRADGTLEDPACESSLLSMETSPTPFRRRLKSKFTISEDELLVALKESGHTWRQIAKRFPGRSAASLQVRYSTKLQLKDIEWTSEMDQKLLDALQQQEVEKWHKVANKVGSGTTSVSCRHRAAQLFDQV